MVFSVVAEEESFSPSYPYPSIEFQVQVIRRAELKPSACNEAIIRSELLSSIHPGFSVSSNSR